MIMYLGNIRINMYADVHNVTVIDSKFKMVVSMTLLTQTFPLLWAKRPQKLKRIQSAKAVAFSP